MNTENIILPSSSEKKEYELVWILWYTSDFHMRSWLLNAVPTATSEEW